MTLRLFLDANVLFTAAYSPFGLSRLLFELNRRDVLFLVTSEQALEEARVNLQLKKPAALDDLVHLTPQLARTTESVTCPIELDLPEDDLLIFTAALATRATHLLTGDKRHFGRLFNKPKDTAGIIIQTVRQFFDERF